MFLLRKLFCIHIWKWFMSFKFTFSFMLFWFQYLLGNFITHSVWWTDHLSRDYDIRAQAFWYIVLYTYQHHYGLHGTSLWNIVLHFTGQAPHTQPWEHLWGKRRISFTLSFIPTSIFMAHFACSGGCYGPAELDPGILCSLFFFLSTGL